MRVKRRFDKWDCMSMKGVENSEQGARELGRHWKVGKEKAMDDDYLHTLLLRLRWNMAGVTRGHIL